MVKNNHHICQVLKKLDLARRVVSWAVELSDYNIQYIPRRSIKLQVLSNFVVEFSSPTSEETPHIWILSMENISNLKWSGVGIVLEEANDVLIE